MWQKSKFLPYSTFQVVKNKWLCAKVPWQRFKWHVFAVRFYSQIYFAQGCYSYLMLVANWKVQLLELTKKTIGFVAGYSSGQIGVHHLV